MLVDIGGRRLSVEQAGHGGPVVVLEAGAGLDKSTWDLVWPEVAAFTSVVRYDRAGIGESDPAPGPRGALEVVADLRALLTAVGIPGPYMVVGHSFGGLVARLYACHHPREVAGVVLVDSSHPEQRCRSLACLPAPVPGEEPALTALRDRYASPADDTLWEGVNFTLSLAQAGQVGTLGPIPLTVIARSLCGRMRPGLPDSLALRLEEEWRNLQWDLARLSPCGSLVAAEHGGHLLQQEEPCVVIAAIRQMVEAVRAANRGDVR